MNEALQRLIKRVTCLLFLYVGKVMTCLFSCFYVTDIGRNSKQALVLFFFKLQNYKILFFFIFFLRKITNKSITDIE